MSELSRRPPTPYRSSAGPSTSRSTDKSGDNHRGKRRQQSPNGPAKKSRQVSERGKAIRLELKNSVLDDTKENLVKRRRELEEENTQLRQQISSVMKEKRSKSKEAEELLEKLKSERRYIKDLTRKNNELEIEVAGLQRKLDEAKSEPNANDSYLDDVLEALKQNLDEHFSCSICTEVIVVAKTAECGHTFCDYCLWEWLKTKKDCPYCRTAVKKPVTNTIVDNYIEKFIEQHFSEAAKETRKALIKDRAKKKIDGNRHQADQVDQATGDQNDSSDLSDTSESTEAFDSSDENNANLVRSFVNSVLDDSSINDSDFEPPDITTDEESDEPVDSDSSSDTSSLESVPSPNVRGMNRRR